MVCDVFKLKSFCTITKHTHSHTSLSFLLLIGSKDLPLVTLPCLLLEIQNRIISKQIVQHERDKSLYIKLLKVTITVNLTIFFCLNL